MTFSGPNTLINVNPSGYTSGWSSFTYVHKPSLSTSTHEFYARSGSYHEPHNIKVNRSTNVWEDSGNEAPQGPAYDGVNAVVENNGYIELVDGGGNNILFRFLKPTTADWISAGGGSGGGTGTEGTIIPQSTGSSSTQKKVFCNFW